MERNDIDRSERDVPRRGATGGEHHTPIDYLSPGKGSTAQGYLWVYRAPSTNTVYYDWQTGRSLECLLEVLGYELRKLYEQITAADHPLILPKSKLGEAPTYACNQREKIEAILTDGRYELDTNLVENAIRITKLGAKNYLFFGSAEAGKQNAILYTLLENCKIHGLKPEIYLSETIEAINRLGPDPSAEEIAALTPARIAAQRKTAAEAEAEPKAA